MSFALISLVILLIAGSLTFVPIALPSLAGARRIRERFAASAARDMQSSCGDIGARTTVIPFSDRPAATPGKPIAELKTSGALFIAAGGLIVLLSLVAILRGQSGAFGAGGLLFLIGGIWRSVTPLVAQFPDRLVVRVALERAARIIPLDAIDAAAVSATRLTIIVAVDGQRRRVTLPLTGLSARDRDALCRLVDQHARLPIAA